MSQQITRGYGPQEVPADFAAKLREMQRQNSPTLNQVLSVARRIGWRTQCLAEVLQISRAAASKRMERATPASWEVNLREVARDCLRDYREMIDDILTLRLPEITEDHVEVAEEDQEYLVEARLGEVYTREDMLSKSSEAQAELHRQSAELRTLLTPHARNLSRKVATLARRLARAEQYVPGDPPDMPGSEDADALWLQNMWQAAASCRATLADLPAFTHPNPGLRAEIAEGLDQMLAARQQADQTGEDPSVDEVDMASLVVSEKLRLLRVTMPRDTPNRARIARRLTTISNRLRLAREHNGGPVIVEGVEIPPPPRVQTMLHGQHLDEATIDRLRGLQTIASQVNGGTLRDSEAWRASLKLSEELDRLNEPYQPGAPRYTAYYLAKVIGITHRAVITRLERYRRATGRTVAARRDAKREGHAA